MIISMNSTREWAGANPAQRKCIEGERGLLASRIINFGKMQII